MYYINFNRLEKARLSNRLYTDPKAAAMLDAGFIHSVILDNHTAAHILCTGMMLEIMPDIHSNQWSCSRILFSNSADHEFLDEHEGIAIPDTLSPTLADAIVKAIKLVPYLIIRTKCAAFDETLFLDFWQKLNLPKHRPAVDLLLSNRIEYINLNRTVDVERQDSMWYGGETAQIKTDKYLIGLSAIGDVELYIYDRKTGDLLDQVRDRENLAGGGAVLRKFARNDNELTELLHDRNPTYTLTEEDGNWWETQLYVPDEDGCIIDEHCDLVMDDLDFCQAVIGAILSMADMDAHLHIREGSDVHAMYENIDLTKSE